MAVFLRLLFCFLGVCTFAYLFHAPRHLIPVSGVIGTLGYGLYTLLTLGAIPAILCFFIATLFISLLCEFSAIFWKAPATIFLSTSIFVLVPGLDLYKTVSLLVFGDYSTGAQTGVQTVLAIAAMALAIASGTLLVRVVRQTIKRRPF